MRPAWSIRDATGAADLAQVRRLVRAHGDARAHVPGVEHVYADADRLPGPYIAPGGGLWLAHSGTEGIGCVALRALGDGAAEVKRMYVMPEWRGAGVGRALMNALIEGARTRGHSTLRLGTLDDMLAAQALYRSLGFAPVERYRPDEWVHTRFFDLPLARATGTHDG